MKRAKRSRRKSATTTAAVARTSGENTVVVALPAPRNPFAVHAHRRRAGAHGDNARTRRQAEKRALRKLIEE